MCTLGCEVCCLVELYMKLQCFGFQKLFRVYEDVNAIILQTINPKKLRTFFNQYLITYILGPWFLPLCQW